MCVCALAGQFGESRSASSFGDTSGSHGKARHPQPPHYVNGAGVRNNEAREHWDYPRFMTSPPRLPPATPPLPAPPLPPIPPPSTPVSPPDTDSPPPPPPGVSADEWRTLTRGNHPLDSRNRDRSAHNQFAECHSSWAPDKDARSSPATAQRGHVSSREAGLPPSQLPAGQSPVTRTNSPLVRGHLPSSSPPLKENQSLNSLNGVEDVIPNVSTLRAIMDQVASKTANEKKDPRPGVRLSPVSKVTEENRPPTETSAKPLPLPFVEENGERTLAHADSLSSAHPLSVSTDLPSRSQEDQRDKANSALMRNLSLYDSVHRCTSLPASRPTPSASDRRLSSSSESDLWQTTSDASTLSIRSEPNRSMPAPVADLSSRSRLSLSDSDMSSLVSPCSSQSSWKSTPLIPISAAPNELSRSETASLSRIQSPTSSAISSNCPSVASTAVLPNSHHLNSASTSTSDERPSLTSPVGPSQMSTLAPLLTSQSQSSTSPSPNLETSSSSISQSSHTGSFQPFRIHRIQPLTTRALTFSNLTSRSQTFAR